MGIIGRFIGIIIDIALITAIIGLSLAVTITVALVKEDFNGGCPLYPSFQQFPTIKTQDEINCNFIIGMHSVAMFIALVAGIYRIVETCRKKRLLSMNSVPVAFVVTYLLVAVLILATACIITVGFNQLCDGLLTNRPQFNLETCRDYQDYLLWGPYDGSNFYNYLITAEASAWLSFFTWFAIGIITLIKACCCKGNDD